MTGCSRAGWGHTVDGGGVQRWGAGVMVVGASTRQGAMALCIRWYAPDQHMGEVRRCLPPSQCASKHVRGHTHAHAHSSHAPTW